MKKKVATNPDAFTEGTELFSKPSLVPVTKSGYDKISRYLASCRILDDPCDTCGGKSVIVFDHKSKEPTTYRCAACFLKCLQILRPFSSRKKRT